MVCLFHYPLMTLLLAFIIKLDSNCISYDFSLTSISFDSLALTVFVSALIVL
jgi:hypothetical protein